MHKKYKMTQEFLDEIFEKVCAYQSEHNCNRKEAIEELRKEYGVAYQTMQKWFYLSKGKTRVIKQISKRKASPKTTVKSIKVAATSVSSPVNKEAGKVIFDYMKKLSTFKRILAVICGFDKLCYYEN